MPFELGMAYLQKTLHPHRYYFLVLEATKYRIQKTLSDMNAYDPQIHGVSPDRLIGIVFEWLSEIHTTNLSPRDVRALLKAFSHHHTKLVDIWGTHRPPFRESVALASSLASGMGLLST